MERVDHRLISPIDYRYVRNDDELLSYSKEYSSLRVIPKIQKAVPDIVVPRLHSLNKTILKVAVLNEDKIVPKRIDGKHIGEISIYDIFFNYSSRLSDRIEKIEELELNFENMEESVLNDQLSDLSYFCLSAFGVEASMANDIRHQCRSEIDEYTPGWNYESQVGSSTMPHKINPKDFENVVSLWKASYPRFCSIFQSQIIEHQGDSTNYDLYLDFMPCLFTLAYATKKLEGCLQMLNVNV